MAYFLLLGGVLDAIRTRGLTIRNRVLYPAELQGQKAQIQRVGESQKSLFYTHLSDKSS